MKSAESRRFVPPFLALFIVLATCSRLSAQPAPAPAPKPLQGSIAAHPDWPKAHAEDVASVDAITAAIYNVISGPGSQPRDWQRFRSLFLPDGRLIPARSPKDSPHTDAIILSADDYITRSSATMAASGFFERGIANKVEQFGNIVNVWSTYESRHHTDDPQPFARGINSISLLKDADRYWIIQILWDSETPLKPIPTEYLPTTVTTPSDKLNANFNGRWVGSLEYRDFSNNQQVFLATWLTFTPEADGNTIHISYIYDDGPTKTVRESSTLTLYPDTAKATLSSDRDKSSDTYDVQGFTDFAKQGRGTLTLTGKSTENSKLVDVRISLTLRRNLYTFRKETRLAGEDFKFRDAYTLTRTEPPSN